MADNSKLDVEQFLAASRKSRTISVIGLSCAFLASALSIVTASISTGSERGLLLGVTVFLWLLALAGMGMWIFGRKAFHTASAQGGWLAQTANAPDPGAGWGCWLLLAQNPEEAESIYGRAVRALRTTPAGFPIRLDLSWLRDEENKLLYAAAIFYPVGEGQDAVDRLSKASSEWIGTATGTQVLDETGSRERYFRMRQGCGSSLWLE